MSKLPKPYVIILDQDFTLISSTSLIVYVTEDVTSADARSRPHFSLGQQWELPAVRYWILKIEDKDIKDDHNNKTFPGAIYQLSVV